MLQPRRALDMDEEGVDLVGQPGDLQPVAGKRAPLDRGAVEIFDRSRPGVCAAEGEIWVHAGRPVGVVDVDQVGGTRQQRHGEAFGAHRRGFDLRLVEAGDEAVPPVSGAIPGPAMKWRLEEGARRLAGSRRKLPARRRIGLGEGVEVDAERAAAVGLGRHMDGRAAKRREGRQMVVVRASRASSPNAHRSRTSGESGHACRTSAGDCRRLSLRLRWRPASSSDRASACRGRRSRRP